jgi:hypothetical protein
VRSLPDALAPDILIAMPPDAIVREDRIDVRGADAGGLLGGLQHDRVEEAVEAGGGLSMRF